MSWKLKYPKMSPKKLSKLISRLVAKEDPTYQKILEMKVAENKLYAKWLTADGGSRELAWGLKDGTIHN